MEEAQFQDDAWGAGLPNAAGAGHEDGVAGVGSAALCSSVVFLRPVPSALPPEPIPESCSVVVLDAAYS